MAANSSLNLTSLDFDTLKGNFVTFLKSQDIFKDYDFSGSNMNVLLDVMSYNSFLNSFYLNMVASEMFLDSAQKLDSVISHAKELNYTPQSYKSSVSFINMTIDTTGIIGTFSIPQGTLFSGTNSNGSYTFTTAYTTTYASSNNTYNVANLAIYEGTYVNDSYVVDYTNQTQKYILSNPNIDISSLTINVIENNGQTNTIFNQVSTLYNLTPSSNVYFLQGAQNNQYEIIFGDGILGRIPQNGAVVYANYRISQGPVADGISKFTCLKDLGAINGGGATISSLTVSANSSSGGLPESIETIRFRAPRYFATQQRAVASDDYASLILANFGGEVSDINVYGGETLPQKQYGRVVVSIKPNGSTQAPDYLKNQIVNFLTPYISLPTRVLTSDPDYLYIKVNSTVQYDTTLTNKLPNDLQSLVIDTVINFSAVNLEKFKYDFRYSRFTNSIDNSEVSIVSNDTDVLLVKRISPAANVATTSLTVDFGNAGEREGVYYGQTYPDEPTIYSSIFTFTRSDGTQHENCYLRDDANGNIFVYNIVNNIMGMVDTNIGTINYDTGAVTLNRFNVNNYGNYISLYYVPESKDLYASANKILLIDPNDVTISIINKKN
jgi:hypothetical protein